MSMLTGLYPATHNVLYLAAHLAASVPTLAERLRGGGYQTAAFTENGMISAKWGFARGFAHYSEDTTTAYQPVGASRTFARALAWAEAHADERFFLFVHTYAVHSPYAPAEEYRSLYEDEEMIKDRRSYEQEVREVDDAVARLVGDLDRALGAERTLLVITSDHGEEFYEHGFLSHVQLYEEVLHVPLLIRWRGHVPSDRVISDPVSLVDLAPTILDLVGLPVRGGVDGVSLAPLLEGGDGVDGRAERIVFAEANGTRSIPRSYVARSRDAKCLLRDGEDEPRCFDLRADPDEHRPSSPSSSPAFAELAAAVTRYRSHPRARPDGSMSPAKTAAPDDHRREQQLRALGYID
jgi:arylsulfatase A-like enzyme